ncbi:hypothetical protein D3C86_1342970 [compost metagenome]
MIVPPPPPPAGASFAEPLFVEIWLIAAPPSERILPDPAIFGAMIYTIPPPDPPGAFEPLLESPAPPPPPKKIRVCGAIVKGLPPNPPTGSRLSPPQLVLLGATVNAF